MADFLSPVSLRASYKPKTASQAGDTGHAADHAAIAATLAAITAGVNSVVDEGGKLRLAKLDTYASDVSKRIADALAPIMALVGSEVEDGDNFVTNLREVLMVMNTYPEGAKLVDLFAKKAGLGVDGKVLPELLPVVSFDYFAENGKDANGNKRLSLDLQSLAAALVTQVALTPDDEPIENSVKLVKSGGVYLKLKGKRTGDVYDVRDFGAKGEGSFDDTPAFKLAAQAAVNNNGRLRIPGLPYGRNWNINDTISFTVPANEQRSFSIEGDGMFNAIRWNGDSNKAIFSAPGGIVGCQFHGVKMIITDTKTGVIAWDIDTVGGGYSNTNSFYDCKVALGKGNNNIAWRCGHIDGAGADISFVNWTNCSVGGYNATAASANNGTGTPATGQRGWIVEGHNTLNLNWFNCFTAFCEKGWGNKSDTGATSAQGGGTMFFYGCGTSQNTLDFEFCSIGTYIISGGRFELGKRFLNVTYGSNCPAITCTALELGDYTPSDGCLFHCERPVSLTLDNCIINNAAGDYDQRMIHFDGDHTKRASLNVRGGGIRVSTNTPFFSNYNGSVATPHYVDAVIVNVSRLNGSHEPTGKLSEVVMSAVASTAYSLNYSNFRRPIETTSGSATTITIPASTSTSSPDGTSDLSTFSVPIGTEITITQIGAGQVTIAPASGVTLRAPQGAKVASQYSTVRLRKRATDEWVLSGAATT